MNATVSAQENPERNRRPEEASYRGAQGDSSDAQSGESPRPEREKPLGQNGQGGGQQGDEKRRGGFPGTHQDRGEDLGRDHDEERQEGDPNVDSTQLGDDGVLGDPSEQGIRKEGGRHRHDAESARDHEGLPRGALGVLDAAAPNLEGDPHLDRDRDAERGQKEELAKDLIPRTGRRHGLGSESSEESELDDLEETVAQDTGEDRGEREDENGAQQARLRVITVAQPGEQTGSGRRRLSF